MNKSITLYIILLIFSISNVLAQTNVLSGKVYDGTTGDPLAGVEVLISELKIKSKTSSEGVYSFENIPLGEYHLIFHAKDFPVDITLDFSVNTAEQSIKIPTVLMTVEDSGEFDMASASIGADGDGMDMGDQNMVGMLSSRRDAFLSKANFTFGSTARFNVRGVNSDYSTLTINNINQADVEGGRVYWSNWGGLNDVTRYAQFTQGISADEHAFGNLGGATHFSTRASDYRPGTRVTYSMANRSYNNRFMVTHSTGKLDNGWAFTGSITKRWATEGRVPGTTYDSYSYFAAIEKFIGKDHALNLTVFGAPTTRGKAGGSFATGEHESLDRLYNPYWGFQNGEMRNSREARYHKPHIFLTHNWEVSRKSKLTTSASYIFGSSANTFINWYDAADPRPDYYRNLEEPAYLDQFLNNEAFRQVQWDHLYFANTMQNVDTTIYNAGGINGNNVTGKRAHYIVEQRRDDQQQISLNTNFQTDFNDQVRLTAGVDYRFYKGSHFKVVDDLLGADYWLDVDQFAERDFEDWKSAQNDLNNPNRTVEVGDRFGWDYDIFDHKTSAFSQLYFDYGQIEFYAGASASYETFWREGHMMNGRFPDNSEGTSAATSFFNYGAKAGATYKITGRHLVHGNVAYKTQAPLIRNSFLSPRTRNEVATDLTSEKHMMSDLAYTYRGTYLKATIRGYYGFIYDKSKIMTFYYDKFNNLVNYHMSGINQEMKGLEMGAELKLSPSFSLNAAAAVGNHQYVTNAYVTAFQDNNSEMLIDNERTAINGFRMNNGPQTALSIGAKYNSSKYWFLGIDANYFGHNYMDFNPISRTNFGTDERPDYSYHQKPIQLKDAQTFDLFAGKSWRLPNRTFIRASVNVQNILNTQFEQGGYEQLRFDTTNPDRFAPVYFYSYGRTFFINLNYSF